MRSRRRKARCPFRVTAAPESAFSAPRHGGSDLLAWRRLAHRLPDLVLGCLARAAPGCARAESAPVLCRLDLDEDVQPGAAGRGAAPAVHLEGGGIGAGPCADGPSAGLYPSGLRCVPVEVTEASGPWLVRRRELRSDSGGAGSRRGGLGVLVEIAHATGAPFHLRHSPIDASPASPAGAAGGGCGASAAVRLSHGAPLPPCGAVPAGLSVIVATAGGGGFGPPAGRDRESLAADVRGGLVSAAAARREYGLQEALVNAKAVLSGASYE